jgi:hypothetical protein
LLYNKFLVLLANCMICTYRGHQQTCLLERMVEPREIMDSEHKQVINNEVTYMGIFYTLKQRDIPPMDTDCINHRKHVIHLVAALSNRCEF